ncbi:MAG: tyrosine-type recombinase/integrase [Sedimentisphaerales bacterium]
MTTNKGGRRKKQIIGTEGKVVEGLSFDDGKSKSYFHRYKENGKWKKLPLGRDKAEAIYKLARFLSKNHENYGDIESSKLKKAVRITLASSITYKEGDDKDEYKKRLTQWAIDMRKGEIDPKHTSISRIPDSYVYARARQLILANKIEAAKQMGINEIATFDTMKYQKPRTLKEIGEKYLNKSEFQVKLSEQQKLEKAKVKKTWERFCKVVAVECVDELTTPIIDTYYDDIYQEYKGQNLSTTWIRGYFERVIRVLNHAILHFDNSKVILDAKNICARVLIKPKTEVKNPPMKITKDDFFKLLKVSNVEERCMWLLSMNCAYYTEDIVTLPKSAINLDDKIIVFRRGKTKEHRSAVLWNVTITVIKQYQRKMPHSGMTFFLNPYIKAPYNKGTVAAKFRAVKKRAGITSEITHQNFRDCTPSICSQKKIYTPSIDAVMGHKLKGENIKYTDPEVYPEMAEDACNAVYNYYFPPLPKKTD